MVNGSQRVFVERDGVVQPVEGVRLEERTFRVAVKNIARILGDDVSEEMPILDARLPDGSRVAAVFPPCSLGGTTLTIRKFQSRFWTCEELVRVGTMITRDARRSRAQALSSRDNILISGGTRTGKDDAAQRARDAAPGVRPHRRDRGHRGTPVHAPQPRAVRGAARSSPTCRLSRSGTCCAPRCGTGLIASSSARCAEARPTICCRR